jgi:hypothetical protein
MHNIALQICGVAMLLALFAGTWGYFQPSPLLLVLAGLAGIVGFVGIALLTINYFSRNGDR